MVATRSGDSWVGSEPTNRFSEATYAWPEDDRLSLSLVGDGALTVALGFLPHSNEPLGSALLRLLPALAGDADLRIVALDPIDPPPHKNRFLLPCDLRSFVGIGRLAPCSDQVEFSHRHDPITASACRASSLREALVATDTDILILIHNDPLATAPYFYANVPLTGVEEAAHRQLASAFSFAPLPEVAWTDKLSARTYAYFPAEHIGVSSGESAGLFIPDDTGAMTLTVELPMFQWNVADGEALQALSKVIYSENLASAPPAHILQAVDKTLGDRVVPMIAPAVNAEALWHLVVAVVDAWRTGLK